MMSESLRKTPVLGFGGSDGRAMRDFVKSVNPNAPDYAQLWITMRTGHKLIVKGGPDAI